MQRRLGQPNPRVCASNLHKASYPYTRALLIGPLAVLGCTDFWNTDPYPSDLNGKILEH